MAAVAASPRPHGTPSRTEEAKRAWGKRETGQDFHLLSDRHSELSLSLSERFRALRGFCRIAANCRRTSAHLALFLSLSPRERGPSLSARELRALKEVSPRDLAGVSLLKRERALAESSISKLLSLSLRVLSLPHSVSSLSEKHRAL